MGRSFESYALRKAELESVETALVEWLTGRGLVPRRDRLLDTVLSDDACRVVVFHNSEWTVVLYSHPFQTSESIEPILSELHAPLLKTWVYDSDLWGYELRIDGRPRAAYNSNPKYFGVPTDQPLPKNGDPDELANALGIPDLAGKVAEVQRSKSLFAELRAEKFAAALGALPLALETSLIPAHLREEKAAVAGGYRVVVLDYAKPRGTMRLVDLHLDYTGSGGRHFPGGPAYPGLDPATMRQIEQTQRLIRGALWVFKPVMWAAGLLIRPLFKAAANMAVGQAMGGQLSEGLSRLISDLNALAVPSMRQDGPWVVNPHLKMRVRGRLTPGAAENQATGMVFCLQLPTIPDSNVNCTLMPPEQVRMLLQHAVANATEDIKFFHGDHQARTLIGSMPAPMNLTTFQTLIRLDDALVMFASSFKDGNPQTLRKAWDEMIDSFEVQPGA